MERGVRDLQENNGHGCGDGIANHCLLGRKRDGATVRSKQAVD